MAMTINTNVISINAQRNLGLSGSSLGTTMQRLSSGLRVNSAKDDAAGLAIAERMNAQARGLKVAARNANDGISLAQTAEGALGKVGDMLQRARELAVQSSNATNSAADRKALQAEVSQLLSEVDRVAKTTSFNGQKILDGSFAGGVFQVGAGAGDNITVGALQNAKTAHLSKAEFGASASTLVKPADVTGFKQEIAAGALQIRVGTGEYVQLGAIAQASSGQERLGQVVAAINAKTADTGVTAFLEGDEAAGYTVQLRSGSQEPVMMRGFNQSTTGIGAAVTVGVHASTGPSKAQYDAAVVEVTAVNKATDVAGWMNAAGVFTVPVASGGALANFDAFKTAYSDTKAAATLNEAFTAYSDAIKGLAKNTAAPGAAAAWSIADNPENTAAVAKARDELLASMEVAAWQQGQSTRDAAYAALETALTTTNATNVGALNTALEAVGATASYITGLPATFPTDEAGLKELRHSIISQFDTYMSGALGVSTGEVQDAAGLDGLSVETQAGAWEAIKKLDSAIDQVNAARANLGALQTRFEKSIENIDIMNENISAARGRIVDADFASETANLSRAQILQQAGTAMVAQANQLPQQVLSLLQ